MNSDLEVGDHRAGEGDDRSPPRDRRREQGLKITLAIHAIYLAFNGLLYVLIQINYQNRGKSPFVTHMAMKSSLVALCVYFCAATLKIKLMQSNTKLDDPRLLNHVLSCFGILCPLSNAMVFLPDMVGCIVIALFVFATTILLAYDVYKLISKCISKRNNNEIIYATTFESVATTSESMALENIGIGDNATTSESGEMNNESSRNNNDAETTSESGEMNNESNMNNNDAVEMHT